MLPFPTKETFVLAMLACVPVIPQSCLDLFGHVRVDIARALEELLTAQRNTSNNKIMIHATNAPNIAKAATITPATASPPENMVSTTEIAIRSSVYDVSELRAIERLTFAESEDENRTLEEAGKNRIAI